MGRLTVRWFSLISIAILTAISLLLTGLPLNMEAASPPIPTTTTPVTATGTISGHIYRLDGHTPIAGVKMTIYEAENYSIIKTAIKTAVSNTDGSYTVKELPSGSYFVKAYNDYSTKYYDNASSISNAKSVSVAASSDTPNIDFILESGGSISGHVYQADGKTPISGALVWGSRTASTSSDGSYSVKGLKSGNYMLFIMASGYVSQYYNNRAQVNVKAESDTPDIDFNLEAIVPIKVGLTGPNIVPAGGGFVIKVNITELSQFDCGQFDVSYDPAVLQVTGVTSGMIGNTIFPIDGWNLYPPQTPGKIRAVGNFPGISDIKGSGYLAEIHFHALDSPGQTSKLEFSNGYLNDIFAGELSPVTWENGSVQVSNTAGDVNGDGRVSMADVTRLELMILGLAAPTPAADINNDGQLSTGDIIKLERILLGLD